MKAMTRHSLTALLGASLLFSLPALADYPEKPITLIVPWAAGGGTDATARTIASAMEQELGQTINVVNRTGGSGVVGHTAIAMARPDGYTLGMVTGEINMMHWQGLTDLTWEDYTPIAQINYDYAGVQVAADGPFDSLETLVEKLASESAGTYKASGTGQGGVWHLAFAGFLMDQGMEADRVTWIPSQGAAPAMTEMAAGGIDIVPSSVPEGRAMIEAGRVSSLGIMAPERLGSFPEVPTLEQAIGSGYQIGEWRGIAGPEGMDPAVVATLEQALQNAYESDTYQNFMAQQGFGVEWRAGDEFEDFMATQDARFGEIVEQVGLSR